MAYIQDFSVTQDSTLTGLTVTDTSTGTDATITDRRIYFQLNTNAYLVPTGTSTSYVDFPLTDGASIDVTNLMTRDYALSITVNWLNASGTVIYTKTYLKGFSGFARQLGYQLQQYQISDNTLLTNRNYQDAKLALWLDIISGDNAVAFGGDITNAQLAYTDAKTYIDNPSKFY